MFGEKNNPLCEQYNMELSNALLSPSSKNKKNKKSSKINFWYFLKKTFSYISGNETFSYFLRKVFFPFPEMEFF